MPNTTGLDVKIKEMAGRIRELREIENYTPEDMAGFTGVTTQEYLDCENGKSDLNFAFIYRCALALHVNVTDIIDGDSPKLKSYTVTRRGEGQMIANAHGMTYYNLAYAFQNRIAEPLYVKSVYSEEAQTRDMELTTHTGQECDIVVEGRLMVQVGEHREILGPGDSIYYNSDTPHGMIAVDGKDCIFYAIVLNPTGEPISELMPTKKFRRQASRATTVNAFTKSISTLSKTKTVLLQRSPSKTPNISILPLILSTSLRRATPKSSPCCTFPPTKPSSVSPSAT